MQVSINLLGRKSAFATTRAFAPRFNDLKIGTAIQIDRRQQTHSPCTKLQLSHGCCIEYTVVGFPARGSPRCGTRAISKSKSLKTGMIGALFEVELHIIYTTLWRESDFCGKKVPRCMFAAILDVQVVKTCTTLWRKSDFEVKIVKDCQRRGTFGSSASENLHHACARERFGSQNRWLTVSRRFWRFKVRFAWQAQGFGTLQNTWQAQEFVRVAKNVGRRGGFEEGPKRCFSRGRCRDSCFVMWMFEASGAESVERLQI